MTTILGIKANSGEEGIVLGTDTQLNLYVGKKLTAKTSGLKLWTGKHAALAFTGNVDKYLDSFLSRLSGKRDFLSFYRFQSGEKEVPEPSILYNLFSSPPTKEFIQGIQEFIEKKSKPKDVLEERLVAIFHKEASSLTGIERVLVDILNILPNIKNDPIEEAVRIKYLHELSVLNRFYARRSRQKENDRESNGEEEDETEIILAVNRPALELYHVDPYGNVNPVSTSEDLEYICLGSGSELAEGYIDEQDYKEDSYIPEKIRKEGISLDNVTIPIAGWLVINALRKARKDARTGGIIDIAVVTHDRIETIEPILRKRIEELEQEEYSEFLNKYETSADKEA